MVRVVQKPPGEPLSFGAQPVSGGVRFRLFSGAAAEVELCIYDEAGVEVDKVPLERGAGGRWQATVGGAGPGTAYGYRVHGPVDGGPAGRFDPARLLVDPYALEIRGDTRWNAGVDGPAGPAGTSLSIVVDRDFDWRGDTAPGISWPDSVIYECHVRGLTMLHPDVPEADRGTYRGLANEAVLDHLKKLGVTAVELMPVHQPFHEQHLVKRGLTNYWGYAPLAFFAPDNRFATVGGEGPVREFKEMVRALHQAGIEVILDVVYNHTGEGNERGETLSFRGIDDAAYYRVEGEPPGRYVNYTGCGNTMAIHSPPVAALVLESLRYWVTDMHVDGFRFDLATTLGRDADGRFETDGFLQVLADDPIIGAVKLIAEPWDLGPDGYALGRFPAPWREWNAEYRDVVRSFWKRDPSTAGPFATKLAGSEDIFPDRGPSAGINFIAAHDGFTLFDLVRYNRKHNEANGEGNADGHDHNLSYNWGTEGRTEDPRIERVRRNVSRAMLASLAFSRGVPMLQQGDELGRTQGGNNNAYCHDDERSWVHWDPKPERDSLIEYVATLFELRRRTPVFRGDDFFGPEDIRWLAYDGRVLLEEDWHFANRHTFLMHIRGEAVLDEGNELLACFNAGKRDRRFHPNVVALDSGARWRVLLDSAGALQRSAMVEESATIVVHDHSVVVLERENPVS
jgi:glycogen operon protein